MLDLISCYGWWSTITPTWKTNNHLSHQLTKHIIRKRHMTLKFNLLVLDTHHNLAGLYPFILHSKFAFHNSKKECCLRIKTVIIVYRYALTLETKQLAKLNSTHMSHTSDHWEKEEKQQTNIWSQVIFNVILKMWKP